MTTPFDDLIRTTLSDIAEEARPVNLTTRAFEQVRRRRMTTMTLGAATAVAAVLIGAPLAFAGGGGANQPTAPTLEPAAPQLDTTVAPPTPAGPPAPVAVTGTAPPAPTEAHGTTPASPPAPPIPLDTTRAPDAPPGALDVTATAPPAPTTAPGPATTP